MTHAQVGRIRGFALFSGMALLAVAAQACGALTSRTYAISPSTVDGNAILAQESALLGPQSVTINLQGTLTQFPGKAHIDEIKIRTVLSDVSDQADDALKNEDNMNGCRSGQDHIGFISSIVIKIKKTGAADSSYVELAHGSYDSSSPCSISLTPNDSLDVSEYAAGYDLQVTPTGKYPDHQVLIGGLISGSWEP